MQEETKFSKKDLIFSLIIGEVAGWLLLVLADFIFPSVKYSSFSGYFKYLPIVFPIACAVGLYLAFLVSKPVSIIYQIAKFILIGGLNFLVDSGIVAILILFFRNNYAIEQNDALFNVSILPFSFLVAYFALYKSISFVLASVNSYLWNKYWTFKRTKTEGVKKEFFQFLIVSLIGFFINVGIAYGVFRLVAPVGNLTKDQWTMAAVVVATFVSMCWNFLGYKFIVFDVKKPATTQTLDSVSPEEPQRRIV